MQEIRRLDLRWWRHLRRELEIIPEIYLCFPREFIESERMLIFIVDKRQNSHVMTTYTSNLLIISNNRPLFAQIRVLVHGRTSTRQLIVDQNIKSENISTNRTGIIQKNSLPTSRALNVTALNLPINGTTKINPENGNADVSSPFGKGVRIALVEPTFTAAAYDNSFYVFYPKYSHVPAKN